MRDERARAAAASLRDWLFEEALPLWWEIGADPRGGFHEQIDFSGRPVDLPQRTRTIARQAFSYCEAGKLGWSGPWRTAARHALEYFDRYYFNADGTAVAAVDRDGRVSDSRFDLYEQAFALLALASAYEAFSAEPQWRARALGLRERLRLDFAHPLAGYREDRLGQISPLRSNPHMHLLEAALAWAAIDSDPAWTDMADAMVKLCVTHFIDAQSGAIREFFASDWSPAPGTAGRIAEPGHQYEWGYLLERWAAATHRAKPLAIERMIIFADEHGLHSARQVAMNSVLIDGSPQDLGTRLWPQAERIRAYSVVRSCRWRLTDAIGGLVRHLETVRRGLWIERFDSNGNVVSAPSPATSLYHLVGAVTALTNLQFL
jgi:mannose-6-phosphate isomerase